MGSHDESDQIPDISRFDGLDAPAGADAFTDAEGGSPARAALIRAAADGELTAEQALGLNDAESGVAFERHLREATGRVMGGVAAPAELRERILSAAASGAATIGSDADDGALADALEERAAVTRSASFWNGSRIFGSVAAALLLAVVGFFGWQTIRVNGSVGGEHLAYRTDLAQFVADEHTRSLDESYANLKYIYKAPSVAADAMVAEFKQSPTIPPCGGATKFRGASPCGVPGKGPSAHMQFVLPVHDENGAVVDGASGRMVSVFVKRDQGELAIDDNTTYLINSAECNLTDVYICVWRRDGLLYTLVSEDENAPMCSDFLAQFGVAPPDPANSL